MKSTFALPIGLGRELPVAGVCLGRAEFFAWAWRELASHGLLGVHEGTLLSESAAEQGLETESWTVDAGLAPRERDWIGGQLEIQAELYFESHAGAEAAARRLAEAAPGLCISAIREVPARDWDAEWRADFLSRARGLVIPPGWHVLPPWASDEDGAVAPGERVIRINPGAGFGTGTHETTQLCLTALAELAAARPIARALDFGSGSGILAIALDLLGAREVDAVEIDPLAIENAEENARLNGARHVRFVQSLLPAARGSYYDVVVANILRPVLLEFRAELVARLARADDAGEKTRFAGADETTRLARGRLVLSGLIERDVDEIQRAFSASIGRPGEVRASGEWRCLVWS